MDKKISDVLNIIIIILAIIFGIFLAYQIFKRITEGSWTTETIVVSLLVLVITSLFILAGFLISISRTIGKLESNFSNLKNSFCSMAKDFKEHLQTTKDNR